MRLADIVITVEDHIPVSLCSWVGKRVVVAALQVSARAEIVQVKVVWVDVSRINWACIEVVGSVIFSLGLGVPVLVPMLISTLAVTPPVPFALQTASLSTVRKGAAACQQHESELYGE